MVTLTRLQQDLRSECYQVQKDDDNLGQLFVFFSHDYLFLDGYLYLNIEEDLSGEEADDLADEIIVWYLNHHCPMDYGQDYTAFEVNLITTGESYLVEMGDNDFYDDEYDDLECECGEEDCECE